jgi:hypothetical protein
MRTPKRPATSPFGERRRITGTARTTAPFVLIRSRLSKPENIAAAAIRRIGSKLSLQRAAKFREEMGNGLRLGITPERRPQTQNKKKKPNYEKSKKSV